MAVLLAVSRPVFESVKKEFPRQYVRRNPDEVEDIRISHEGTHLVIVVDRRKGLDRRARN